jgi:hypothetical protein
VKNDLFHTLVTGWSSGYCLYGRWPLVLVGSYAAAANDMAGDRRVGTLVIRFGITQ